MQVITPENHVEFITTGKVAEFKPPEAKTEAKPDAKPAETTDKGAAPAAATADAKPSDEKPRASDGKFVKAGDTPAVDAEAEADADAKLTEKIQKLINKKHRQMKEAEEFATGEGRRAIEAERRAEQLQREIDALKGTKSEGPKTGDGKGSDPDEPQPGDFKTVGEYTRALTKYEVQKAGKEARATNAQTRQQEQADEQIRTFAQRQDEFRKTTPDYDEVVEALEDDQVHPVVMQYIVESEVGPALLNHLAKTPSEIQRLRKLSPTRQVAELGKLEIKFDVPAAPNKADAGKTAEISKAPAPISPLKGESATVSKDPSQMNFQELRAFREQERRAKAAR